MLGISLESIPKAWREDWATYELVDTDLREPLHGSYDPPMEESDE